MLKAVVALEQNKWPVELRVAATDASLERYRDEVRRLGLEKRVKFLGVDDDMADSYRSLDVYVLSSWTEGMPRTVVEAMASGLPVVVTRVGGTVELVRDGLDGPLVGSGEPLTLAEAIMRRRDDCAVRELTGRYARTRVEKKFTTDHVLTTVTQIYESILEESFSSSRPH